MLIIIFVIKFTLAHVVLILFNTGDVDDHTALLPSDLILSPSGSSIGSNGSGDKGKPQLKIVKVGLIYRHCDYSCVHIRMSSVKRNDDFAFSLPSIS